VDLEKFAPESNQPLPLSIDRSPTVPLADHGFGAGQVFRVRALAVDRCALGAHTGFSRWLAFQVVTPEELFYEILMRQREQRAKFAAALALAEGQAAALEKLAALDGVPPLARTHQAISRQVALVTTQLGAILREMTLNELGNPAARALLEENIIRPLGALHSGPLAKLRAKLEELVAAEKLDNDARLGALTLQQEALREMRQILARMSQWESFVDVINQLRQIIKLQTQLRDSTEEVKKQEFDEIFKEKEKE
jgi:hypothetical protein